MQLVDQPHAQISGSSQVFMSVLEHIFVATRSKYYLPPEKPMVEKDTTDVPSSFTPPSFGPLHTEKPSTNSIIRPPP